MDEFIELAYDYMGEGDSDDEEGVYPDPAGLALFEQFDANMDSMLSEAELVSLMQSFGEF